MSMRPDGARDAETLYKAFRGRRPMPNAMLKWGRWWRFRRDLGRDRAAGACYNCLCGPAERERPDEDSFGR